MNTQNQILTTSDFDTDEAIEHIPKDADCVAFVDVGDQIDFTCCTYSKIKNGTEVSFPPFSGVWRIKSKPTGL